MNIVVFGHSIHPYTLAIMGAFQERNIHIMAVVERTKIDYGAGAISTILKSEGVSAGMLFSPKFLNPRNLLLAAQNPWFTLVFLKDFFLRKATPQSSSQYALKANLNRYSTKAAGLRIYGVGDYNGKKTEKLLRELRPDLLILGPTGQIIKRNILAIPRIGVLNSHMGLLPEYRGLSALEWSILNRDKLGITTHFVDVGVDTGDIIARRPLDIGAEISLEGVISMALEVMADSLAVAVEAIRNDAYKRESQDPAQGKQYFLMHPKLLEVVRARLKDRAARGAKGDKSAQ